MSILPGFVAPPETAATLVKPVTPPTALPAGWRRDAPHALGEGQSAPEGAQIILSFDVEEHYRIEAAAGLKIDSGLREHYCRRLEISTRWLLDQLALRG